MLPHFPCACASEGWLADQAPVVDFVPSLLTVTQSSCWWSPQVPLGCPRGKGCQHGAAPHYSAKLAGFCEVQPLKCGLKHPGLLQHGTSCRFHLLLI